MTKILEAAHNGYYYQSLTVQNIRNWCETRGMLSMELLSRQLKFLKSLQSSDAIHAASKMLSLSLCTNAYMWQQKGIIIRSLYTKIRLRWNVGVNTAKDSVNTRLVSLLTRGRCILLQYACYTTLVLNSTDLLKYFPSNSLLSITLCNYREIE